MAGQAGSSQAGAPGKRRDWRVYTRLGFIGVIFVLALVFIFQNTHRVAVEFLWFGFEMQMWILLLIMLVVGMLVGLFLGWRRDRRRRRQIR